MGRRRRWWVLGAAVLAAAAMAAGVSVVLYLVLQPPPDTEAVRVTVRPMPADWREYGDAPDGGLTFYAEGASTGQFPTRAASGGPVHDLSGKVWLGFMVSPEGEPRDRDTDDGMLDLQVTRCAKSSALVLVNTAGLTLAERASPVYLNLLFDWNRDGRWQGGDGCAQEWAVQNLPVDVSRNDESNPWALVEVPFTAGGQVQEFWYRAMVTRQRAGPQWGGLPDGETEDYLHQPALTFSARPGAARALATPPPNQPTFRCRGTLARHGVRDFVFRIEQEEESGAATVRGFPEIEVVAPFTSGGSPLPPEVIFNEASAEIRRLGDQRLAIDLRTTLRHAQDGPERVEGPFWLRANVAGSLRGGRQERFAQAVDCGYLVDHHRSDSPPDEGFDWGVPRVGSFGFAVMNVIDHVREEVVLRVARGRESVIEGTVEIFQGLTDSAVAVHTTRAALAARGLTITRVPHGLRIGLTEDLPDRLEWFVVFVSGMDQGGRELNDVYRFFVNHGPFRLDRTRGFFTPDAPPPAQTPTPTATSTPTPTATPTSTPTATPPSTPAAAPCALSVGLSLRRINVEPGQFHEGEIEIVARDERGAPVPGARIDVEANRSDGQVTRGTVTTNERGEATARMRTTAFGQNTLRVASAQRAGCTWAQQASPPSLAWEARP